MLIMKVLARAGMLFSLALWCSGCGGGGGEDLPETVAVSGVVTYQGKPVTDASIMFYPLQGRKPATGRSDTTGKFTLRTFEKDDGALPGEHQVTVNAYQSTPEGVSMKSAIPIKYSSPTTSPLKITVTDTNPEIKLELID
ncbi:carboxypeptidase-like regulatory domain-containing protein [Gimesia sp.]|uniref:carboxypeptidase-like regulatory domain-containing protein n=1 Tax=Gimesia sp. TaxID=2024833 RepID=UPI003A90B8A1